MEVEIFPPDYSLEYQRRINLIRLMKNDAVKREALMQHYKLSPKDFINDFCITYNPRNQAPLIRTMPFMLFRRQEEFIDYLSECLKDRESGLVEKARDIGATWLCCAFSVWLWLFSDGAAVGWGSRKEMLVDRLGDPDSIFEKMRMIIRMLPPFMLPIGFDMKKHAGSMKIINPERGNTITGESGDNIGRGGRSTLFFKDESAHYERPELIESALGDNTDVQIDISSVHGTANVFYRRRMAGVVWKPGMKIPKGKTRVFIFDWRDHPGKTQEWYDMRREKSANEGLLHLFAQEVDRDYTSSIEGVIIPAKWVKAAIDAHIKLKFEASGEKCAGQDVADEGGDKHALAWRHGVVLQDGQHWGDGDGGDAARRTLPVCAENGIKEVYYDAVGCGASFKTETNRLSKLNQLPAGLRIQPWFAGAKPLQPDENIVLGDTDTPLNKDYFANLKIQSWWRLRTRFEKTYKSVTQGAVYDPDELISLPSTLENLHIIERELSQAVYKHNTAGKLLVDKQPEGTLSPNLADAIVICYNPTRQISILDVVW